VLITSHEDWPAADVIAGYRPQAEAEAETVLIYSSTGGRPKARRMTTKLTGNQPLLYDIFGLDRWAPRR
jgi:hypothetical protein